MHAFIPSEETFSPVLYMYCEYSDRSTHMSALHEDFILNSCACCYVVLLSFTSKVWLHKFFFCQSLDQEMHCVIKNCICYNISFSEIPFWLHLSQNFGSCPKQRPISLFCAHFCLKTLLGSTEGQLKRK